MGSQAGRRKAPLGWQGGTCFAGGSRRQKTPGNKKKLNLFTHPVRQYPSASEVFSERQRVSSRATARRFPSVSEFAAVRRLTHSGRAAASTVNNTLGASGCEHRLSRRRAEPPPTGLSEHGGGKTRGERLRAPPSGLHCATKGGKGGSQSGLRMAAPWEAKTS